MKRNTLHFLSLAALLATQVQAYENFYPRKPLISQPLPTYVYTYNGKIGGEDPKSEPIYNLFQLSALIANKKENVAAASYINGLIASGKLDEAEKEKSKIKLYKYLNFESLKIKFKEDFSTYLHNRLFENINDKEFLIKYKLESENKVNIIHSINELLNKYKSINIIEQLNFEVFNYNNNLKKYQDSLSSKGIDGNEKIKKYLNEYGDFKISSLNNVELQRVDKYSKEINLINLDFLPIQNSKNRINEIISGKEYSDAIIKDSSAIIDFLGTRYGDIKMGIECLQIGKLKEINETDSTRNIQKCLYVYKELRTKRDTLFNQLLNNYSASLPKDTKSIKIESSKFISENKNLDLSLPLKSIPLTEKIEDKIIPNNSIKIPSESDVIHGLALFMANRAKQETMIWFIDKLKKELSNTLIKEAFPLTYEKIMEHDDLRVPEFNSSWQMAISDDFVRMPSNILESKWLGEKAKTLKKETELKNLKNMYSFSQRFISLVNGKNDFRNVIEDLYTQSFNYNPSVKPTSLYRSIEFLYILSNEFFLVDDNKKVNYLNYADFEKISEKQWQVFLDLVKVKYGESAYNDLHHFVYTLKGKDDINQVNKRVANITNTIESIESLARNTDYTSKEEKAFALIDQTITLLKQFDPGVLVTDKNFNSSRYLQIQQFEDVLNIYKLITKKEFGSAVKRTLNFIKPFIVGSCELELDNNELKLLLPQSVKKIDKLFDENNSEGSQKKSVSILKNSWVKFDSINKLNVNLHKDKIILKFTKPFANVNNNNTNDSINKKEIITPTNNVEVFELNLSEIKNVINSEKFAGIKLNDLTEQHIIELLNEVKDLKKIIEFSKNSLTSKNINEWDPIKIKNFIGFIQFLVEASDNPLKAFQPLIDNKKRFESDKTEEKETKKEFLADLKKLNTTYLNDSGELLVKTTTFFSDILHARNEEGVYRAINNAVAPPTSYMTKRKYPHTITLNGYVGGYFGYQSSTSNPADYKSGFTYGITAPIGLTYSTKKWGLFIYPIDLGNLVGHYIWETNKEYEKQKVSVKEVFSPGMSFLYNIPDSPFVLFTGMKMVQIPEYLDENRGYVNSQTFDLIQFNAGIKIDIPFFTIKAWKPKKSIL